MLRRLLAFSSGEPLPPEAGALAGSPAAVETVAPAETAESHPVVRSIHHISKPASFDQIYQSATVRPRSMTWGILKVAEMIGSAHLAGMSLDAKRSSVLMALEAAGAEIEDILQDAVARQRALNDYEETRKKALKDLEAAKLEENRNIQSELDRLSGQFLSRIQTNLDLIAAEQDKFETWQREKQVESQRIAEAATYCVRQGGPAANTCLTAVLERATVARR